MRYALDSSNLFSRGATGCRAGFFTLRLCTPQNTPCINYRMHRFVASNTISTCNMYKEFTPLVNSLLLNRDAKKCHRKLVLRIIKDITINHIA